jgi:hypothetical protein
MLIKVTERDTLVVTFHFPDKHDKDRRYTICNIYWAVDNDYKNKKLLGRGISKCHLEHDMFDKKVGKKVALQKAMSDAKLPRKVRTQVWYIFWDELKEHSRAVDAKTTFFLQNPNELIMAVQWYSKSK